MLWNDGEEVWIGSGKCEEDEGTNWEDRECDTDS
jgi:hypothetical protein